MTDNSLHSTKSILSGSIRIALVIAILALGVSAQTKGTTPVGLSPGSPAGSYPLSDFETVNLFNGGLNFNLSLLNIGGRGGTGYSLPIHIEQKWSISKEVNPGHPATYSGHSSWWSEDMGITRKLDVGRLQVRRAGTEDFFGPNCGDYRYKKTLTRITFTAPDGTEYELRDQLTGGQPAIPAACSTGFNRQKVFVTADGTSATYISDVDIIDAYSFSEAGEDPFRTSGYMMLRDGTHFRVFEGNVLWMRDRNGNRVSFGYDAFKRITSITDSLNRTVTINYGSAQTTTYYDEIAFKGFGGATRTLKIGHCLRSDAMREGISVPSPLFSDVTVDNNNPIVINYIELPDGRRYQIQYNAYAEIARVVTPTGGAIEYDWANGLTDGAASGLFTSGGDKYVYRRVTERRMYPDGGAGSAWESKMMYSRPESTTSNAGYVVVDQYNSSNVLLGRSQHYFHGSARDSFLQKQTDYPAWQDSKEYKTETFDSNGTTLLRRVENIFDQRQAVSWWTGGYPTAPPNDVRLIETKTTLADTNQVSKQTFGYDDTVPFNNQNNVKEYDFGDGTAGSLVRETRTTFVTNGTYTGTDVHLRNLPSDVSVYDGLNHLRAQTVFEYDSYSTADAFHAFIKTYPPVGVSQSPTGFDPSFNSNINNLIRGNVTKTTRNLLSTSGAVIGSINSYAQYDVLGNVVKALDPRSTSGNLIFTTFDYADNFGAPDSEARTNSGASELNISPGFFSYALPTVTTNALGHTTYTQYDYYLGKPVNFEDANGIVGSGSYDDLLDRPKLVKRAIGTTAESHSTFDYDDASRVITTTSDQDALDDGKLVSKLLYDKMGRTVETRQYEGGTNYIAVQTQYDPLGRPYKTSNPFRPWQSETAIWTTRAFDALGRVKTVTTPDSAVVTTNYLGNTVTVIDQAGKTRKSVTDGLGRLTSVYEAPDNPSYNYLTSYAYDTLDNLTTVSQGSQTRTFVYDSLKRLTSATNPESGTICYGTVSSGQCQANGYDAAGNLIYKTDARLVRATYGYDALNRNTSVTYTNDPASTPTVTRTYDGATNGKGLIWKTETGGTNGSRTTINSCDAQGRTLSQAQQFYANGIFGPTFAVQRTYDLAGHVRTQIYPSGHVVTYNYDSAGRLADRDGSNLAFTGNLGDGSNRTYSRGVSYTPLGGLSQEQFGTDTAIYNKLFYNSRGQLAEIREGLTPSDDSFDRGAIINFYGGCWGRCGGHNSPAQMTENNGNLRRQEIYIPNGPMFAQTFDYDSLNRLHSVSEDSSWRQEYVYDRYGNRTIHQTGTWNTWSPATGPAINKKDFTANFTNKNQLGVSGGQSGTMTYDNAGNLTTDTYSAAAVTRAYDAENRMTSETQANSYVAGTYSYNADGQRVRRTSPGQPSPLETWQIYGMDGELLAEYAANAPAGSPQKEYGYRNGQLLITAEASAKTNVAASAQGAMATAQNYTADGVYPGLHFQPSYAIDGVRYTSSVGDHYWRDEHGLPSWLQIDFNGAKTIDEVDVYTMADNYNVQADPSATQTFANYGTTGWNVQYWTGSAWQTVPGGSVSGGNLVWKKIHFTAVTTSKIRVVANAALEGVARIVEVESWGHAAAASPTNVARTANGATATAQNYTADGVYPGLHFQPSYAIDGVRYTSSVGDHYWRDEHGLPSWLQIDFNGAKTIDEVDVYTMADNYNVQADPSASQTFANYGTTGYDVQYWTGSAWQTVSGGSVSGGNLVWKKINFTAVTTSKIRLVANAALEGVARIVEVEAWTVATNGISSDIHWLVTDQLGTPRMIFDKTGSLAGTKRHDYLPFGEELLATQGGRTTAMGYTAPGYNPVDGVRQKFTSKERDNETGLDYFLARYYSSIQGRFTSPDEFTGGPDEYYKFHDLASQNPTFYSDLTDPQSLNKYQYGYNNPLLYIDPDGHQGIREAARTAFSTFTGNIKDMYVAEAKTAANIVIDAANMGAEAAGRERIDRFEPSNNRQDRNMRAMIVGLFLAPAAQKAGPANVIFAETKSSVVASEAATAEAAEATASMAPKAGSQGGPGAGRNFPNATKDAERAATNNTCRLCGVRTTRNANPSPTRSNIDHAVPKSRGGNNTRANAQNTCQTCNLKKGTKTTREFLQ